MNFILFYIGAKSKQIILNCMILYNILKLNINNCNVIGTCRYFVGHLMLYFQYFEHFVKIISPGNKILNLIVQLSRFEFNR